TAALLLRNTGNSLYGACVDNIPNDKSGDLYYICSTETGTIKHLELSTKRNLAIKKLEGFYAGFVNTSIAAV
ncbi:26319_t:CDS:1, partial [Dentiscutata erythropus]